MTSVSLWPPQSCRQSYPGNQCFHTELIFCAELSDSIKCWFTLEHMWLTRKAADWNMTLRHVSRMRVHIWVPLIDLISQTISIIPIKRLRRHNVYFRLWHPLSLCILSSEHWKRFCLNSPFFFFRQVVARNTMHNQIDADIFFNVDCTSNLKNDLDFILCNHLTKWFFFSVNVNIQVNVKDSLFNVLGLNNIPYNTMQYNTALFVSRFHNSCSYTKALYRTRNWKYYVQKIRTEAWVVHCLPHMADGQMLVGQDGMDSYNDDLWRRQCQNIVKCSRNKNPSIHF